jgi:D-alanyl-D-alanine carboxypeptidase/D-alanyl-D-alanine-endopeptidase (penicillin-binding protein 4)
LGLIVVAGVAVRGSSAQPEPAAPDIATEAGLRERVKAAIAEAQLGARVGVSIVDAQTGRAIVAQNAELPLNPASNQKLLTAAVALLELGADFRMLTGLYGTQQGTAIRSGLYLKSFGDPTLGSAELGQLADQLVARGVTEVDEVIVDGSYFDDQVLPPGFADQPDEVSAFRAAVAATSVNANAFTMRISPGVAAGAPAALWLDAEGYFAVSNQVTTAPSGAPNVVAVQSPKHDKLSLRLSGTVPIGISGVSYRRRVSSPLHYAGYALVEALRSRRIQVPRRVSLAKVPSGTALLASRKSPPLAEMLGALGKESDNFTAEMVLKVIGAERVGVPGKTEHGARTVAAVLRRLGLPVTSMRIVNGSGLFGDNQVAAAHLSKLLAAMYANPAVAPEFVSHLAVGGVDGTLSDRLAQLPSPRIVRAKTGTLADVIALSGYVLGRSPSRVLAFSVLCNDVQGKQGAARSLGDRIATEIARHLWAPKPAHP